MKKITFVPQIRVYAVNEDDDLRISVPGSLCKTLLTHLTDSKISAFPEVDESSGLVEGFCIIDFHSRPDDEVLIEVITKFLNAKQITFDLDIREGSAVFSLATHRKSRG